MNKSINDVTRVTGRLTVAKYDEDQTNSAMAALRIQRPTEADFAKLGMFPREICETGPNLVVTNGLNRIVNLIIGSGQAATNTAARIGVGNDNTAAAAGDTDLGAAAGSSNRYFEVMDSTYPSVSGAVITFKSTFGSSDGNFDWEESCVDIGTPTVSAGTTVNALMLNHLVESNGTKSSGASWVATFTLTASSS